VIEAARAKPESRPVLVYSKRFYHLGVSGLTEDGEVEIAVPRDRAGSFEPQLIAKGQTRFDGFDDKILSLYARGMTVREIQGHVAELCGTEVSPDLISRVDTPLAQGLALQRNLFLKLCVSDAALVRMRSYDSKKITSPNRSFEVQEDQLANRSRSDRH
jgi:transposase-like protein